MADKNSKTQSLNLDVLSSKNTAQQFDAIIAQCREVFEKKTRDYGTSWRVMRPSSFTDQIFIKAKRIKTIDEKGSRLISDTIEDDFIGIINYCILALIQLRLPQQEECLISNEQAIALYDETVHQIKNLMLQKNHDYGEAWRDMRLSSFTDMVLMRLMRLKQIEDNKGTTLVSEGPEANYMDIVNYCVFALIKLNEEKH